MHLAESVRTITDAPKLPSWVDRAIVVIRELAKGGGEFTADAVTALLPPAPHVNSVGAAFKHALDLGLIQRCEGFDVARSPFARGRRIPRWKGKGTA